MTQKSPCLHMEIELYSYLRDLSKQSYYPQRNWYHENDTHPKVNL